ncbi:unnamed protein product [Auanema sp. JU1783]|nr:unnamed protein product [Auanema sp. JU1783]
MDIINYLTGFISEERFGDNGSGDVKELKENHELRRHIMAHEFIVRGEILVCQQTYYASPEDFGEMKNLLRGALDGWVRHPDGLRSHLDQAQVYNLVGYLEMLGDRRNPPRPVDELEYRIRGRFLDD